MSELKLNGTIKMIGELQTFDSGFVKREFVVTTKEQYPQDVKFELVKDKATEFMQYNKVGQDVEVKFNVRGNEYNGKFYVNLQAWYVGNNATPSETVVSKTLTEEVEDDLPF